MKKIVVGIILIVLILFVISRIYHFIVISRLHNAIDNFKNEENRYYCVIFENENIIKEEILLKNNILKCNEHKDDANIYCEWKDFNNNQDYSIDLVNKKFTENDFLRDKKSFLKNLPKFILEIYPNDKFNLSEFLKISYIIPTEYNNQKCYKIIIDEKICMVNRETYLPIYYSSKRINSNQDANDSIENVYEFKVGEVTDEDIMLPDLTDYTKIQEK